MPTAVVSGRVPRIIQEQADKVIRAAGTTPAEVIKDVWVTIAETGELPRSSERQAKLERQRQAFQDFMKWRASLPPCPELATMTIEQMKQELGERDV